MYASPELAKFAVDVLDGLQHEDCTLQVCISNRRLEWISGVGSVQLGQSRWGEDIFNFPSGY